MADPPPFPDDGHDTGAEPDRGPRDEKPPDMPLWVKVFGIVAIVLVLAFGVVHLTVGGLGQHSVP